MAAGIEKPGLPQEQATALRKTIVVIDTDPGVRWALEKGLSHSGYIVRVVNNAGDVLRLAHEEDVAAIIMEFLPEAGLGGEVLSNLVQAPCAPKVICVSIYSDPRTVIDCVRLGATDFLPKPFGLAELRAVLSRVLASEHEQRNMRRPDRSVPDESSPSLLIGVSHAMQELRTTIQHVARTDLNCLLRGESGTGKDMVAREIHRLSIRRDKPFIKVNCTALPEQLLESELFGYEKGAFTGALSSKPGRFELANRGIIFLDEIGDMQPSLQAKLLQVIEHKEFTKLGGRKHIHVDVQIIAATNADLEKHTRTGEFRDDLYFRLNEVCIWVPSLEERKEDIPLLVRHFLQKHGRFSGDAEFEITGEDIAALTEHDWPGNVRELESTIKRWLALGQKVLPVANRRTAPRMDLGVASAGPRPSSQWAPAPPLAPSSPEPPTFTDVQPRTAGSEPVSESSERELEHILEVLNQCKWNRRKAADMLGMSYQTLRRRIERHGLDGLR